MSKNLLSKSNQGPMHLPDLSNHDFHQVSPGALLSTYGHDSILLHMFLLTWMPSTTSAPTCPPWVSFLVLFFSETFPASP